MFPESCFGEEDMNKIRMLSFEKYLSQILIIPMAWIKKEKRMIF